MRGSVCSLGGAFCHLLFATLIEGHGADPDIVVDNLPHDAFSGDDAQLQAAIQLLQQQIKADPRPVPPHPPYPDKSFHYQN